MTKAIIDVLIERDRQVEKLGYDNDHDDDHQGGELACAAGSYALYADSYPNEGQPPPSWPWADNYWKPKNFRQDMVRAAALLLAEIERFDRAEKRSCARFTMCTFY